MTVRLQSLWCALVVVVPSLALAQPHVADLEVVRVKEGSGAADRVAVYVSNEVLQTFHSGAFNIASSRTQADGSQASSQFVFKATGMEMQTYSPQVGLKYAFTANLLMYVSAGASFLRVLTRLAPPEFLGYDNQQNLLATANLQPGFAGTLGAAWAPARFANFTLLFGIRLTLNSASSVASDSLTGTSVRTGPMGMFGVSTELDYLKTQDANITVFNARASAGLEWRPRASFLSNHFGINAGYGVAFGSLTTALRLTNRQGAIATTTDSTSTTGFLMQPSSVIGVYYGWSVFIPRFGTLSLEGRVLDQFSANFTYQYTF